MNVYIKYDSFINKYIEIIDVVLNMKSNLRTLKFQRLLMVRQPSHLHKPRKISNNYKNLCRLNSICSADRCTR